jgi:serine/threonine-protein kinase
MVFGTPEFMSPEQAQGKSLTAGSDIYSLAVILYEVLTGKLPFEARTAMEFIQQHVTTPPIPIDERVADRHFPPLLWKVIERALKKAPEERYGSAADFAIAMNAVLKGATIMPPTLAPPAPVPPEITPSLPVAAMIREEPATQPDGPRSRQKMSERAPAKTSMGLLIGVAAACLVMGVVLTMLAMKFVGH